MHPFQLHADAMWPDCNVCSYKTDNICLQFYHVLMTCYNDTFPWHGGYLKKMLLGFPE